MILSEFSLEVKIGCSRKSHGLVHRFQTYAGYHLLVYVWDIYYDNNYEGLGWHEIEMYIHNHFQEERIFPGLELFHLYRTAPKEYWNRADNLMDFFRLKITQLIMNHRCKLVGLAYDFGIRKRAGRAHITVDNTGDIHGCLIYVHGCDNVYDRLTRAGKLVVEGKEYRNDEIGLVNSNSLMDLTQEFLNLADNRENEHEQSGEGSAMHYSGVENPLGEQSGQGCSTIQYNFTPSSFNHRSGTSHFAPSTDIAVYSGAERACTSSMATARDEAHYSMVKYRDGATAAIDDIARTTSSLTPGFCKLYRNRVVVSDDDEFFNQDVGLTGTNILFPYPKPNKDRGKELDKLGYYDKKLVRAFDHRVNLLHSSTLPTFTLLLSNYMQLPLNCRASHVSLSYRLWRQSRKGDDNLYEYRVEFEEPSTSAIVRPEDQDSIVLVLGDPLHKQKMARVKIESFKVRDYLRGIAIFAGLCKIFASDEFPVILAINKPHENEGIVWDIIEEEIIVDLGFKFNRKVQQYEFPIPVQSIWQYEDIVPSEIVKLPPFRGRSMLELFEYEKENGIFEDDLPDEEVEKLLKLAKKLTLRNQRNRQKYDGEQEGYGSQSQSTELSQSQSQSQSQSKAVEDRYGRNDNEDDDDSFIDRDEKSWDDDSGDDGENDNDFWSRYHGAHHSFAAASQSESEDDVDDGWVEPSQETSTNVRNAMWITFYGRKSKFHKVGDYHVIVIHLKSHRISYRQCSCRKLALGEKQELCIIS